MYGQFEDLINSILKNESLIQIFNSIEDNLSIMDEECNILWANKIYCERLGKKYDEILGKKCYSLWHHRNSPCPDCPCIRTFHTNKIETIEKKTAEGRYFLLTGIPITLTNGKKAVFEIGKEITEQKVSKEKFSQTIRVQTVNSILNNFCHHLNNIFTGIYGFSQLLMKDIKDETTKNKFLKLIKIIERGINFSKSLEKLKISNYEENVFDLNYLVISMKNTLNDIVSCKDIELKISLSKDSPIIKGNIMQIREILIELVSNATEAIQKKGTIWISTDKVSSKVLLLVKDSGYGMNYHVLKKCFEPFFSTNPQKLGIGLTLVKNIIEMHDGSVEIESQPDSGTTVKIYFPAAILPQEQDT